MEQLRDMITGLKASVDGSPVDLAQLDARNKEEWAYIAGTQIWLWGISAMRLELSMRQAARMKAPLENLPAAPINQFGHSRHLLFHNSVSIACSHTAVSGGSINR